VQDHTLVISGKTRHEDQPVQYLHRGIAGRSFERRFELADTILVGGASLVNGLLHVDLKREVPESAKPRSIPIAGKGAERLIQSSSATAPDKAA